MTHSRSIRASFQRQKPAAQKFLLCVILCLCGCEPLKLEKDSSFDPQAPMERIISPRGTVSINIPLYWEPIKNSSHVLYFDSRVRKELYLGYPRKNRYVTILSTKIEPRDRDNPNLTHAVDYSLREIAEFASSQIPNRMENAYVERGPIQTTINGRSAIQYVFRFTEKGIDAVGLYTVIKRNKDVYTMVAMCPSDQLEECKEELLAITRSFQLL